MSLKMLKRFTINYLRSREQGEVVFGWQGGEPTLLGVEFFEKAMEYQKKYAKKGIKLLNTLQTNGTLLDDKWGKFLSENNFLVGISIDGPPKYHDFYRKYNNGKPSFEDVKKGLDVLKKWNVEYNILACVHKGNEDHPLEVYNFFRDELETDFIQFIPIVERVRKKIKPQVHEENRLSQRNFDLKRVDDVYAYTLNPIKYGKFLFEIFKEWVKNDVGKVFVQIFDTTLSAYFPTPPGLCCFSETCGDALVMEYNGDLFTCDHFVEPEYYVGNVNNDPLVKIVTCEKQVKFGRSKFESLPKKCLECNVRFICNGGCLRNRFVETNESGKPLNYLCEGYKYFFTKTIPYMKVMADFITQGKPAAEIMRYLKDNPLEEV